MAISGKTWKCYFPKIKQTCGSVVVDLMFFVTPMWESVIVLCFVVCYFVSILVLQSSWWGRESWMLCLVCLPGVSWLLWLFLAVPWVCLQFVIVVFPDHTHFLFLVKGTDGWIKSLQNNLSQKIVDLTITYTYATCTCSLRNFKEWQTNCRLIFFFLIKYSPKLCEINKQQL